MTQRGTWDGNRFSLRPDAWSRLDELRRMPYEDYLQTSEWKSISAEAVMKAGFRCRGCDTGGSLEVHHRTYARRGNEELEDLTPLCHACHRAVHVVKDLRDGLTRNPPAKC